MSSTYRILCLSHDPAIILEPEWTTVIGALDAVLRPADHVEIANHASCDLVIGAFSPALAAVCCPPRLHPGDDGLHKAENWITADWLHVLAAAHELPHARLNTALKRMPVCWSPTRIHRLRNLLEPAPVAEPIAVGASA